MKQLLLNSTSVRGPMTAAKIPPVPGRIGFTDQYIKAIEEALPVGSSLTAPPDTSFHNATWLLQVIMPNSIKESAKTGVPESECRAKILRVLEWDKVEFTNRLARRALFDAGQKPSFEGLCNITDPDLFVSVLAFSLGYKPETRVYLGFRDPNKFPAKWLKKYKKSPETFTVIHGTYKAA